MIFSAEIRKITKNSVMLISALTLFLACVFLSYYNVITDRTETLTEDQIRSSFVTQTTVFENNAKRSLKELDRIRTAHDSYSYEYYERVIELYSDAREKVTINNGSAKGWDKLLNNDTVFILSLIASVVIGAISVFEEKRTGSINVIFASKNGREKTAAAKIGSAMLISFLICIVLSIVSITVFLVSGALSDGSAAIQTAYSFRFSPYDINLNQAFLAITAGRALLCVLVCGAAAILSSIFNSYILILTTAILPIAVEFIIYKIDFRAVDIWIKNVNLFSLGGSYLLKRYYSVRLFGCSDAYTVCIILAVALIFAVIPLFICVFCNKRNPVKQKLKNGNKTVKAKKEKNVVYKTLFGWELRKNILKPLIIIIMLAFTVIRVFVSSVSFAPKDSANEEIYREYCEILCETDIAKAKEALNAEKLRINTGLRYREIAENGLKENTITKAEYDEMMVEYGYCTAREYIMQKCDERMTILVSISRNTGADVRFVYDTGLNKFLSSGADFILVLLQILCIFTVFTHEYESGFYPILHTSLNGRRKTFINKILLCICLTSFVFIVFSTSDLIALVKQLTTGNLSASVMSLKPAYEFRKDISIREYIIILYAVKFIAHEILALIIVSLSALIKRSVSVFALVCTYVFVPYLIKSLGGISFSADIAAFLSGNEVLLAQNNSILHIFAHIAIAVVLVISAYFSFCRKKEKRT